MNDRFLQEFRCPPVRMCVFAVVFPFVSVCFLFHWKGLFCCLIMVRLWSLKMTTARIIEHIKTKKAAEKAAFKWLPHKDSNLNKQIQNLRCYHYTMRQWIEKRREL